MQLSSELRLSQDVFLSVEMQMAYRVMQMPLNELTEWLELEIDQNPLLERIEQEHEEEAFAPLEDDIEDSLFGQTRDWLQEKLERDRRTYQESLLTYEESLYEKLLKEAAVVMNKEEFSLAEFLIGNIDHRGFLDESDENSSLLGRIRPGIGAQDMRSSLLLQLKAKGKEETIAYAILKEHFGLLLKNKLPQIARSLSCSLLDLRRAVDEEIITLDFLPGSHFDRSQPIAITPDLFILEDEERLYTSLNEEPLPEFRIMVEHASKESLYTRRCIASAKWIQRIVYKRNRTLLSIADYLIKHQKSFLKGESRNPQPMRLVEVAEELAVHESTISRAVGDKYIATPIGLLALKSFFSHSIGGVSTNVARQVLQELINDEDKCKPLSDASLSVKLSERGIPCSRRTVAKYRASMKLLNANQRKEWK